MHTRVEHYEFDVDVRATLGGVIRDGEEGDHLATRGFDAI